MKKMFIAAAIALCFSHAKAQIPTVDAASIAKLVMQIEETQRVLQQATATTRSVETMLSSSHTLDQLNALQAILNQVKQANALGMNVNQIVKQIDDFNAASFRDSRAVEAATARQATLTGAAMLDRMPGDAERINRLVGQSQAAGGVLQAQQAGNQINAELAGQLMSLRQQLIMQAQAQQADQLARQKEAAARSDMMLTILGGKSKFTGK